MAERLEGKNNIRFVAVEPASCPSLTRGRYAYDFRRHCPDHTAHAHVYAWLPVPALVQPCRRPALPRMSPILSKLYHDGYMEARSYRQTEVFDAALQFARCEGGTLPAPESSHAIRGAIDEALECKRTGEKRPLYSA